MREAVSVSPDGLAHPLPTTAELRADFERLAREAEGHRQRGRQVVAVQGLGFVGTAVTAAVAAARDAAGEPRHFVIGVDRATPDGYWKVARLGAGQSPVAVPDPRLPRLIAEAVHEYDNLRATAAEEAYSLADVVVIDVPLDVCDRLAAAPDDIEIDLTAFRKAVQAVGRHMRPGALVLVESTVPVGACERIVLPALKEQRARRGIGGPLHLGHAYERVMPGPCYVDSVRRFWRVYAGVDLASAERARDFLASFVDTDAYPLQELPDTAGSELAKLLENSYRAVNIALIHEWTLLAERVGVNLFEVIDAIRLRRGTHDNMRYPGFGVGGYCLTKDSLLAQWSATHLFETGTVLEMTLRALEVNYRMPLHTLDLLAELCEGRLAGRAVLLCGASYLADVADTRNSPAALVVDRLHDAGARVLVHDPCLASWPERPDVVLRRDLEACLPGADAVVFAVPHRAYRELTPEALLAHVPRRPVIVDAQNIIPDASAAVLHAAGCRLLGVGKGHWRKRGYQCPI